MDTDNHTHVPTTHIIFISAITSAVVFFIFSLISIESPSTAQNNEAPAVTAGTGIPEVIKEVSPAVVSIVITADVPILERYYQEFGPFGFSVPRERQVGTEERQVGGGSGFFVSPDGYIVTNRHVVDDEDVEYSVVTDDGTSYEVRVVAKDPMLDIAVLKVDSDEQFPYLAFGQSDSLQLGQTVIAIGNVLAEFPNSVSVGVVSGLSRDIVAGSFMGGPVQPLEGLIQTDAAINRGNSGGPLLSMTGEVIGVNVAIAGSGENISFALPANPVRMAYESVRDSGEIVRPFMGVRYVQINESIAARNDLPVNYGVLLARGNALGTPAVLPGSPADEAGLTDGDIILEFDGTPLTGEQSLASLIRQKSVGEEVTLTILRNEEEQQVTLTLEQAPTE